MVQEKVEMEEQQTSLEAELSMEAIQGDRSEEDRITEAEKNERQRKMLQVCDQNLKENHLTILVSGVVSIQAAFKPVGHIQNFWHICSWHLHCGFKLKCMVVVVWSEMVALQRKVIACWICRREKTPPLGFVQPAMRRALFLRQVKQKSEKASALAC